MPLGAPQRPLAQIWTPAPTGAPTPFEHDGGAPMTDGQGSLRSDCLCDTNGLKGRDQKPSKPRAKALGMQALSDLSPPPRTHQTSRSEADSTPPTPRKHGMR